MLWRYHGSLLVLSTLLLLSQYIPSVPRDPRPLSPALGGHDSLLHNISDWGISAAVHSTSQSTIKWPSSQPWSKHQVTIKSTIKLPSTTSTSDDATLQPRTIQDFIDTDGSGVLRFCSLLLTTSSCSSLWSPPHPWTTLITQVLLNCCSIADGSSTLPLPVVTSRSGFLLLVPQPLKVWDLALGTTSKPQ